MILFRISDVMRIASQSDFNAGMEYYRQGRSAVKSFEMVDEGHMVITATTKGSHNYVQSISVMVYGNEVRLNGRCSCGGDENCKHVVSAALTFMNENTLVREGRAVQKSEGQKWLERLEKSLEPEPVKKSILIYRISPTQERGKLQLVFYRARLLKEGGYGKQKRIEFHQLRSSFMQRDFLTDNDREILELFGALESKVKRNAQIEGELGGLLLEKMVKSGNCYWHGNRNRALKWGEPLSASLLYKAEGKEHYRLALDLGKQYEPLITLPLSYVDTKEHIAGRLKLDGFDARQLGLLLQAPLLTKEEVNAFALKAIETLPSLPLPDTLAVTEIKTDPKAKLTLFASEGKHCLKLRFLYDAYELEGGRAQTTKVLKEGDTYLKIIRDNAFEKRCEDTLQTMGFVADESGENDTFMPEGNGHDAIEIWRAFVQHYLPDLKEDRYVIEVDNSFLFRFEKGGEVKLDIEPNKNWFDVEMSVDFEGEKLNLLSVVSALLEQQTDIDSLPETLSFEVAENHFITLDSAQFRPVLKTLLALYKGERVERLEISSCDLHLLPKGPSVKLGGSAKERVKRVRKELESFDGIEKLEHASGLQATLRGYQQEGLNWLGFLERFGFGGILADDMGLGKTLQTLAFLQRLKEQGRLDLPVLIVAPTSLLGNWKNEAKKFTPDLRVELHHGLKRNKNIHLDCQSDIVITTYALLSRDLALFEQMRFGYFILDEAQNVKNLKSKVHSAARKITAKNLLALTGTPMENHLGELWSIFDVVMPGFLGDYSTFKQFYQTPIEQEHSLERQEILRDKTAPFMLRRTKEKVATELPPKTVMTRSVTFEGPQAKLYEGIRIAMEKKVREVIAEQGLGRSHITILDALLKLRQVCCDPRLVPLEEAKKVHASAKLEMLLELVEELLEEGRRILIFSQFTSMLSIIEEALLQRSVPLAKLTGSTQNREKVIEHFTGGEAVVFLISLKAGGVGLNLTEADTVIHYDPWWNPAAEEQATDRAYRIGQEKPVFVYKLIIEDSVEEKILALQEQKKQLANSLFSEKKEGVSALDAESLLELFS
ncbi:DEAD/DEAH box helicase [Sulfurimonas sp. HSL3-7]|uniref:DEAD/DEAH box helicase n=1 Tax=Sulfonitrofixus jiaomeiensis TaxID=3131938 RepID=UPI0031F9FB95